MEIKQQMKLSGILSIRMTTGNAKILIFSLIGWGHALTRGVQEKTCQHCGIAIGKVQC